MATQVYKIGSNIIRVNGGSSVFTLTSAGGFLEWDAVTGAVGYRVYWDTVPIEFNPGDYANSVAMGNVLTAAQSDFSGLGTGTRYFNIKSYDESNPTGDLTGLFGPYAGEITVVVT